MVRNLGGMRHRVRIMTRVEEEDELGGQARNDTELATVSCSFRPATDSEIYRGNQLDQRLTHVFKIRFRDDVKQGMSMYVKDRHFYVVSAKDKDELKRFLTIMATEGGSI